MTKQEALDRLDAIVREVAELKTAIERNWAEPPLPNVMQELEGLSQEEREARADAWLAETDALAERIGNQSDVTEDIHQVRMERLDRL